MSKFRRESGAANRAKAALATLLALTATACGASSKEAADCSSRACDDAGPASADARSGCASDQECDTGFCDRTGACGEPDFGSGFGTPCTRPPETALGTPESKLDTCGAYLCLEGRCRSCVDDRECQLELDAPQCRVVSGEPGRRCGRYN